MTAAQFLTVGEEAISLSDITPLGDGAAGTVEIQTLDSYGFTDKSYMYIDYAGPEYDQVGWIDNNAEIGDYYELVTDVTFPAGAALWVFGADGLSIQSAGQVNTSDVTVTLKAGATAVGNPYPMAVALADILPLGDGAAGTVEIQTLDAYGFTDKSYMYIDYAGPDYDQVGWIDNNAEIGDYYELVTDVTFPAGAGLWVFGAEGLSIRFPAPEL
ncbi:MAG: hypothetical protein J6Q84_08290 [Kiritimatiellae bacterium]|nr:hypothetical protein [Kiritimatiellia bacterium]